MGPHVYLHLARDGQSCQFYYFCKDPVNKYCIRAGGTWICSLGQAAQEGEAGENRKNQNGPGEILGIDTAGLILRLAFRRIYPVLLVYPVFFSADQIFERI